VYRLRKLAEIERRDETHYELDGLTYGTLLEARRVLTEFARERSRVRHEKQRTNPDE